DLVSPALPPSRVAGGRVSACLGLHLGRRLMVLSQTSATISGLVTMGFLVASLFFARFWRLTCDGLFAAFAAAFLLLALNQALTVILDLEREELGWIYLLRLAAFLLIILAIVQKNWRGKSH